MPRVSGGAHGLAGPHAVRTPHVSGVPERLPAQGSLLPGEKEIRPATRGGMTGTQAGGHRGTSGVVLAGVFFTHVTVEGGRRSTL